MRTAKGTPWTTEKVNNLFAQLRLNKNCLKALAEATGAIVDPTPSITTSHLYTGTLDDTQFIGGLTGGQSRLVEVQMNGDGTFEVVIKKSDGSVLIFQTFGNSAWSYEGLLSEAPISEVVLTNITGSAGAIPVIINIVSRS